MELGQRPFMAHFLDSLGFAVSSLNLAEVVRFSCLSFLDKGRICLPHSYDGKLWPERKAFHSYTQTVQKPRISKELSLKDHIYCDVGGLIP